MFIGRRNLLATASAMPLFAIGRARAAEFTYKLATGIPGDHPLNVRAQEACDRILKATSGQVEVKLFINNQLGNDQETLKKIQTGEVEFFAVSGANLSAAVPVASINGLGFAFKDYPQIWRAMDGNLGAHIRGESAKLNIHLMRRIWDSGFRETTTSTKPILTPADFRGLKLRIPVSPLWTSMFKAFGSELVQLTFADVYKALEAGTAHGQENPLALIQSAKLHEVQTYCSLTNHMWDGRWIVANGDAWRRLSSRTRDAIENEFDRSCQDERDDLTRVNPHLRGDLVEAGLQINPVENAEFRRVLQKAGFYAEWRGRFGEKAWGLLEDCVGTLA